MSALLSLIVCLAGQPDVCDTVIPGFAHADTGQGPTFFECLGLLGQDIARKWLSENPGFILRRIQCSASNNPARLRDQIASPRA
jgi:hypothetical protein